MPVSSNKHLILSRLAKTARLDDASLDYRRELQKLEFFSRHKYTQELTRKQPLWVLPVVSTTNPRRRSFGQIPSYQTRYFLKPKMGTSALRPDATAHPRR